MVPGDSLAAAGPVWGRPVLSKQTRE